MNNDLITGIHDRTHRKIDRLTCADGDQYVVDPLISANVEAFVEIPQNQFPKIRVAGIGGVCDPPRGQLFERSLPDTFGRCKVRLTYAEADMRFVQQIKILTDPGGRDLLDDG